MPNWAHSSSSVGNFVPADSFPLVIASSNALRSCSYRGTALVLSSCIPFSSIMIRNLLLVIRCRLGRFPLYSQSRPVPYSCVPRPDARQPVQPEAPAPAWALLFATPQYTASRGRQRGKNLLPP